MDIQLFKLMKMYGHVRDFMSIHALSTDNPGFQNMWFFFKYLRQFYSDPPKNGNWAPIEILKDLYLLGLISLHSTDDGKEPWTYSRFYTFRHVDQRRRILTWDLDFPQGVSSLLDDFDDHYASIDCDGTIFYSIACIEQYASLETLVSKLEIDHIKTPKDLVKFLYQTKKFIAFDYSIPSSPGVAVRELSRIKVQKGVFHILQINEDDTKTIVSEIKLGQQWD